MIAEDAIKEVLAPGTSLRKLDDGLFSALPEDDLGAPYDRVAAGYDRAVSMNFYLRLAWGITRADNQRFIEAAFGDHASGWIVDLAAGSCVDSVGLYAQTARPTIVLDRSVAMLERGVLRLRERTGSIPPNILFLQADATALPFADATVETMLCHGAYHVFHETEPLSAELRRVAAPHGAFFVSSLVRGRAFGNRYLALLRKSGEIAEPREAAEFADRLANELGVPISFDAKGNFAYARGRRPNEE